MKVLKQIQRISDVNFTYTVGSGIRRILNATYQLSGMVCIRKVLAAVRTPELLKKRFSSSGAMVEGQLSSKSSNCTKQVSLSPSRPRPNSDQDWLILQTSGLGEVRAVSDSLEGTHERILFFVLDSIGLLSFLIDVWRWQEVDICQDFVLNWNHKTKTTKVIGVHIDASYQNFLAVTGLEGTNKNQFVQGDTNEDKKKRAVHLEYIEAVKVEPISYSLLNDPVLQSLLLLLNNTLWFTKYRTHCPTKDMVYLLVQSMKGEKLDWSESVYEKFINEIQELQDHHDNYPDKKLQTLAGPLMCYLYSQAKRKAEALKPSPMVRGKKEDMRLSIDISPRNTYAGIGVLKEKNHYDYDDGEVVPLGFRSKTLKLPFPPSAVEEKRSFMFSGWSETVLNLLPPLLSASTSSHSDFHIELEDGIPQSAIPKIMAFEDLETGLSTDMKDMLNKTFEEQKLKQERFKLHLRSSWQQPFDAECSYGCCSEQIRSEF